MATVLSIGAHIAAFIAAFGALGAVIGLVLAHRRGWLLFVSFCLSTIIYLLLCFKDGIFSFRFPISEIAISFVFDQSAFFLFFCLLPTMIVAALIGLWRVKRGPRRSIAI